MNKFLSFAIFFLIACSIYFFMHFLIFRVLIKNLSLSPKWMNIIKIFFILSGLSFPVSITLTRVLKFYLLNYYANIWLGITAIAFFVAFIDWVLVKFFPNHAKIITIIAVSVTCLISAYSIYNGLKLPVVKKVSISLKNLPEELDGFSIVQVSDLHLEPYKSKKVISSLVDSVNKIKPGLIVITGDLIEGDINNDGYFVNELKKLKAEYGVIAVTGNHEFYAGIDNFEELANKTNIKILRNDTITLANTLQIIGLDDDDGRRFDHNGPDLESMIPLCDQSKPIILLYHRPTGFDKAVEKGVDLQLCGHAHAGQIPPMDILVHLVYKYPSGLYEKNGSYIYTSPGTGYWGPPMRFLSKSEITHIVLKSTGNSSNHR